MVSAVRTNGGWRETKVQQKTNGSANCARNHARQIGALARWRAGAELTSFDEDLFALPEAVNAACCLHFELRVDGRLHQEHARGGGQRDACRAQ